VITVFLWQADPVPVRGGRGVCDDRRKARRDAAACLRSGQASSAMVEEATAELGLRTLTSGYYSTGRKWQARIGTQGRVRWVLAATSNSS